MKIKYKFFLVCSFISLLSLSIFFYFSYQNITQDKTAYLLERHRGLTEKINSIISKNIELTFQFSQLLLNSSINPNLNDGVQDLLDHYQEKYQTQIYRDGISLLRSNEFEKKSEHQNCSFLSQDKKFSFNVLPSSESIHLLHWINNSDSNFCVYIQKSMIELTGLLNSFKLHGVYWLKNNKFTLLNQSSPISNDLLVQNFIRNKQKSLEGGGEASLGKTNYFTYRSPTPQLEGEILILTKKEDLFSVFKDLLLNLFGFFFMILAITFGIAIFFTRRLTNPINEIISSTSLIADGNFDIALPLRSKDELGTLTIAVNKMASDIKFYIGQIKEKARIEQEVLLASTLHENFFPDKNLIQENNLEIFGKTISASEVGGDWWGVKTIGHQTLILIGDATGHGVPAAFITTISYAFYQLMDEVDKFKIDHEHYSPALMMTELNRIIYRSSSMYQMTFSILCYNSKDDLFTLANASHYPPLIIPKVCKSIQDVKFIITDLSERIGEASFSFYKNTSFALKPGERLGLLTDGITEARNQDGQEYGERRMLQCLIDNNNLSNEKIIERSINQLIKFTQTDAFGDDLTVILIQKS
ncbi:SpoIIE family protein phosphatase [Bacteriovoracaceae bacterium]|nr:SpoIIE family protein phosphatase [Bacteriovoracaceae bacterium]